MKLLTTCFFITMLLFGHTASAKDYCQPMPKVEKEGDAWYIPESAFTQEAANEALTKLKDD